VEIIESCKVTGVRRQGDGSYLIDTSHGVFEGGVVCGSYGKYTPSGIQKVDSTQAETGNYIGVKYHFQADLPSNRIELHNFSEGYCGVSKVDRDQFCLCYLTTSANLLNNGKNIRKMEQNVLFQNPLLRHHFEQASFISREPLVISNIGFRRKTTEIDGMFLLGDAAGSITPLCGNGMSMAMHASKMLADELTKYFGRLQSLDAAHLRYRRAWTAAFGARITAGYYLQHLFGKKRLTDLTLRLLSRTPSLTNFFVSLTHGERF
jgi:menaquinone-9 beta-reductase